MRNFNVPEIEYTDPWDIPLGQRESQLFKRNIRVAYLYTKFDNSTFRYRCYNTARALNSYTDNISASWFQLSDGDRLLEIVKQVDVLVLCRMRYRLEIEMLVQVARKAGVKILGDVDDLVFDVSSTPTLMQTLGIYTGPDFKSSEPSFQDWFGMVSRVSHTLRMTDGVITTNPYLSSLAETTLDLPSYVVPNFLGEEQLAIADRIVSSKNEMNSASEFIDVGYFSGSPSHNRDFEIAAGSIRRVMEQDDRVRLHLVGYLSDFKNEFKDIEQRRIIRHKFTDFINLERLIAQVDINIAPLQLNHFTNCKSELKYFDAGIVEVPTLASPSYTMLNAIDDGTDGTIVQNHEWEYALTKSITHLETTGRNIARQAREKALKIYTPEENALAIREAVSSQVT